MNDRQRRRHERGLRVRDFAETVKDSFTAKSKGAESIARVRQLVENLSALDASHATNKRAAMAGTSGKNETREELRAMLSRISRTARAIGMDDPALRERFRLPATNPNSQALVGMARSFLAEATPLNARFVEYGLGSDFLDSLGGKIEAFESFASQQNTGASARKADSTAIDAALDELDAETARLDAILRNKFADDSARLAAWESARRLERAPRKGKHDNKSKDDAATTPTSHV
jgi:hypothetical protein